MRYPKVFKRLQERRFLVFHGAAADQHRTSTFCGQRSAKALYDGWSRRQTYIELKVPSDLQVRGVGADRSQSDAIFLRLREKKIDMDQHPPEGPLKAEVARPRSVRDPGIDDCDASSTRMCQPQEIWPELRFRKHDEFRPQDLQVWPDGKGEIHWEIKDVLFAETLAGELLPGVGGGRHQNPMLRKRSPHL